VEKSGCGYHTRSHFVRAGSCWERFRRLADEGNVRLSSLKWSGVESGASLSTDAAADYFAKSEDSNVRFCRNFRVGRKLLRSPTFPKVEVELERRLALQNIRSQQEQPLQLPLSSCGKQCTKVIYASSGLGYKQAVASLDRADLERYHQTYFRIIW